MTATYARLRKSLFLLALVILPDTVFAELTLGAFPRRSVIETVKAYTPLANHLSQELGEKVRLVVPRDFPSFWHDVINNRFDIVHFNQYHYIKSHKEYGYNVFATNEEHHSKHVSSAIVVRKDSQIKQLSDLKGKTILFGGGRKAMISYIVNTQLLKQAGLIEGVDYQARFAITPANAAIGVARNLADAAGTGNIILQQPSLTRHAAAEKLTYLVSSAPLIHLPWAVDKSIGHRLLKKISNAMLNLQHSDEGKTILRAALVTGFSEAKDSDFDKIREITFDVTGEKY